MISSARTLQKSGKEFYVVTGDDDTVVPVRASRRVAELLGLRVEAVSEMAETGTLVKKN